MLNVEIRTLSDRPLKSGLMWLRELLHPMDSLERMYSPSIAMYPSKCVCINASFPQWPETRPAVFWTAYFQPGYGKILPDSTKLHCGRTPDRRRGPTISKFGLPFIISWLSP